MSEQRRLHERFLLELPVVLVVGDVHVSGRTQNLSLGGMLITVDAPIAFGAAVIVRVHLPAVTEDLEMAGTVRWTGPGSVGVQFGSLRARAMWALNQLFKDLRG